MAADFTNTQNYCHGYFITIAQGIGVQVEDYDNQNHCTHCYDIRWTAR